MESLKDVHDATLDKLEVQWQEGLITISLILYQDSKRILIRNFNSLSASRNFEWGKSFQVNTLEISGDEVIIEMQSGDYVNVKGEVEMQ